MQGNILILTHWSFKDALVQTYTLPYVNYIREALPPQFRIYIVTSEQPKMALTEQEVRDINTKYAAENIELICFPYQNFGVKKMVSSLTEQMQLIRIIRSKEIAVVHAFGTVAGGMAWLLSRFVRFKLVVDSYEPHAEAMVENGTWKPGSPAFRILNFLEKKQTAAASALIATTAGMKDYARSRFNVEVKNLFPKPAGVKLQDFAFQEKDPQLMRELGLDGKLVCVYAGKLGGIYLKEEVFDLLSVFYQHLGDRFRFVMLTNASREEIEQELKRVGIPSDVVKSYFVPHKDVPRYLSLGDFGINPVKPVPTKRYCTSIKDGEYWASGLPVIITKDISDDSDLIQKKNIGYVLRELSQPEYERAYEKIMELIQQPVQLRQQIREIAREYRDFDNAKKIYKTIYSNK